jgi:ketosteroid isomerase-like protein
VTAKSASERLTALEARAAIAELPGRYADAFARLDLAALVALYVPDVRLQSGRSGRDALHAYFAEGIRSGGLHTVVLHTGNHAIELIGTDRARGTVYCHVEVLLRDGSAYQQAVLYTDRYRCHDGTWCFAEQRGHELFYGAPWLTRPNDLEPAEWPRSQTGRGTVPHRWPSWQAYWSQPPASGSP